MSLFEKIGTAIAILCGIVVIGAPLLLAATYRCQH